ncbi:hypothetical protein ACO22_08184 [Paracoccidioides brasiliensis]|uniref:Uncharacterized protein n=1 Tax=Paracoccidioides brasiliensis TaxID=121759 RepID=A0A1D2J2K1_PARBR|nr:hypothetical protein ACO22_08184 [Paracoccidioides brasiliensis]
MNSVSIFITAGIHLKFLSDKNNKLNDNFNAIRNQ